MDIQLQKSILIEQFKQVTDINLINAIQSMLEFAKVKENNDFDIPQAHQDLVMERYEKARKNPERLLDWDEAKKTLGLDEKAQS